VLRQILFVARADLRGMLRARETWIWAFLMPVLFMYVIGTVSGGFVRPARREVLAMLAPGDAGFLTDHLQRKLERHYAVTRVADENALARYRRRLILPANFTSVLLDGSQATIRLVLADEGLRADYDRFRVSRAVYQVLAELSVVSHHDQQVRPDALVKLEETPRTLTTAVESAGPRRIPPTGFEQAVPGVLVMFLLLTMLINGGIGLVAERNQGILKRLAATPLERSAIVAGKCGARWTLGLMETAFAMVAGTLIFRVTWGRNWPAVAGLLAVYALLVAMLGVLLGNLARNERQIVGLGVISANVLGALGGCWWPVEITPLWAQRLALLLPTGWAMDALHKLISFGEPVNAVLPHFAVMAAAALAAAVVAARSLRWG
jgi:ABC-2 type transport system permease protein